MKEGSEFHWLVDSQFPIELLFQFIFTTKQGDLSRLDRNPPELEMQQYTSRVSSLRYNVHKQTTKFNNELKQNPNGIENFTLWM